MPSVNQFVAAQRALVEYWGYESFEQALRSWIATVAIIEVEYVGEWEEYSHELTARDYLEEVRRRSGSDWEARHTDLISPWDERFRAATVEREEPMLAPLEGEAGWWQYREPLRWRKPHDEWLATLPSTRRRRARSLVTLLRGHKPCSFCGAPSPKPGERCECGITLLLAEYPLKHR